MLLRQEKKLFSYLKFRVPGWRNPLSGHCTKKTSPMCGKRGVMNYPPKNMKNLENHLKFGLSQTYRVKRVEGI